MGRRAGRERVLGPYPCRRGEFLVQHITGPRSEPGSTVPHYFATEEEALGFAEELRGQIEHLALGADTIEDAITKYDLKHLRDVNGSKEQSRALTVSRLKIFFGPVLALRVGLLSSPRGVRLYDELIDAKITKRVKDAPPNEDGSYPMEEVTRFAVATHQNMLAQAKSFTRWCVQKKIMSRDPLATTNPKGKANKGKPQLYDDEAKKWLDTAIEIGDAGAVAAMMTLLLDLRCSEIVERLVRDVDSGGTVLQVPSSKTRSGQRKLEIPELLQPLLLKLTKDGGKDRDPNAWLFPAESESGRHWRDWPRLNVQRICDLASVPVISAHGMRGTHASLARESGHTAHAVAAAMGHSSTKMHEAAYATREAVQKGTQRRALLKLIP